VAERTRAASCCRDGNSFCLILPSMIGKTAEPPTRFRRC
jgi:hypothetical protein